MLRTRGFLAGGLALVCAALSAGAAQADVVAEYTAAPTNSFGLATSSFEESFTSVASGPEHDISVEFFTNTTTPTAYAPGTAYLLTQAYTGAPSGLSASTPGFLASAVGVGGFYTFGAATTLQPGAQYFLYEAGDQTASIDFTTNPGYAGGALTVALTQSTDYGNPALVGGVVGVPSGSDAEFVVIGTAVGGTAAVPEPASLAMMAAGFGTILIARRRRA